jgi:tRNA pseudouridine synthase 9
VLIHDAHRGEKLVDEPLLTVDRQMGLNIVHPDGKTAQTIFTRLHYDAKTNSSVLHCAVSSACSSSRGSDASFMGEGRPLTGRCACFTSLHRKHVADSALASLQRTRSACTCNTSATRSQTTPCTQSRRYGCAARPPSASPERAANANVQGPALGKGGIDVTPSEERAPPAPPPELAGSMAEGVTAAAASLAAEGDVAAKEGADAAAIKEADAPAKPKLLPRETGHDIGMGSPVPLSAQAVGIITRLRSMKVRLPVLALQPAPVR